MHVNGNIRVRIKVSLYAKAGELLDYNHCYELAGKIREALEFAEPGIFLDEASKLYTFSRIMVKNRAFDVCREGMKLRTNQLYFFFSSIRRNVCNSLMDGLVELQNLKVGGLSLEVSGIEVIKEPELSNSEKFVTLSPVNFRGRYGDPNFEEKLAEELTQELIKRHFIAYGSGFEGRLEFEVLKCKPVRIRVGSKSYRAHLMVFNVFGSRRLIEIGYKSGFGRMTDYGFGMVRKQ